jgi:dihydroxyacetone kinase-like predicted kinase
MALDPDDGLLAAAESREAAVLGGIAAFEPGLSLVTLWYGDGANLGEAERLAARIRDRWPAIDEVEVRHGGQAHYPYLVSAE